MGYNTTVFILNDQFHRIKADPQRFVDELHTAISMGGTREIVGQTTVMSTAHADDFRLYATHQNSIVELSPWRHDFEQAIAHPVHREHFDRMVKFAQRNLVGIRKKLKGENP